MVEFFQVGTKVVQEHEILGMVQKQPFLGDKAGES